MHPNDGEGNVFTGVCLSTGGREGRGNPGQDRVPLRPQPGKEYPTPLPPARKMILTAPSLPSLSLPSRLGLEYPSLPLARVGVPVHPPFSVLTWYLFYCFIWMYSRIGYFPLGAIFQIVRIHINTLSNREWTVHWNQNWITDSWKQSINCTSITQDRGIRFHYQGSYFEHKSCPCLDTGGDWRPFKSCTEGWAGPRSAFCINTGAADAFSSWDQYHVTAK